ncbi:hypothetical protein [Dactylosporangium sp. NPDC005555]|uniref:hypothetical protein n=1 Tax=Dactylosporangium sp. NPDC005555 TaxID=3154889 RepID=UPI0033AE4774
MTMRWSGASAGDVAAAVEEFARRVGVFDPPGGDGAGGVELRVGGGAPVSLSPGSARAFIEALRAYQDPRDRGTCDHCGGPRLDDNFVCADCGQPSGLFGQLLRERAARFEGPPGELSG